MGVLVIRRTLAQGRTAGLITGLGVASADAIYAVIAAFGITFLSNLLISAQPVIRLVGGAFLLYLGVKTFRARPAADAANTRGATLIGAYGSALALTLTNPSTILLFAGIFAGAGLATSSDITCAALLVAGVFTGSALWWVILTTSVSLLRSRFTPAVMVWVNRASGVIIAVFGVLALASILT